jgi:hypothetical protein
VRREDRHHLEPAHRLEDALGADRVEQRRNARLDRLLEWLRTVRPREQLSHAMPFLGQVRELEVAGERARDELGALGFERTDDGEDGHAPFRRRAPAKRDRRPAEPLDVLEEVGALRLRDHTAEDRRQQTDVAPERRGRLPVTRVPYVCSRH